MGLGSILPVLGLAVVLGSCAPKKPVPQWLMPAPQLFRDGKVKPFAHVPARDRTTTLPVHYATNRNPLGSHYGNKPGGELRFGLSEMEMGDPAQSWEQLVKISTMDPRPEPIEVRLRKSNETARAGDPEAVRGWLAAVERDVRRSETGDIIVYVHGAKVTFLHACAFTAELDHFSGRDFTPVAFDWPTHPGVFQYLDRVDLAHTVPSARRLAELLGLLASHTSVRRIHVVSWSAGTRVLSRALHEMGGEDFASARKRYRLGTVIFAAGDVPGDRFLQRLPAIHGLSDKVVVYLSDDDFALRWSSRLMGGGRRIGLAPQKPTDGERRALLAMPRLEVIDTSYGKEQRGFDITGHRYWFEHPWVNSDLILTLRTRASPSRRGLKPAPVGGVWYFGAEYPARISGIGRELTAGEW